MKKILSLFLILFIFLILFNNYCFATDTYSVNEYNHTENENVVIENNSNDITIIDLYSVFYLIAFILVVIFLYIFISHILRIK